MSRESVQFAEMVREAYWKDQAQQIGEEYGLYCEQCGSHGMYFVRDSGRDEIYRCPVCGCQRWIRVR